MATCSASTLLSQACANGFDAAATDPVVYRSLKLQLLCNIFDGGGGGGGGGGLAGAGSPEGVVTADPGTTYWDTSDETLWVKSTGTGNTGWAHY